MHVRCRNNLPKDKQSKDSPFDHKVSLYSSTMDSRDLSCLVQHLPKAAILKMPHNKEWSKENNIITSCYEDKLGNIFVEDQRIRQCTCDTIYIVTFSSQRYSQGLTLLM